MADRSKAMIRVENLTAGYGDEVIIEDVSFEVARGEVFVIAGSSGVGKSTLLKHMIGLHRPLSGKVFIGGEDMMAAEGEDRLRILSQIGVTYQMDALFGSMSLLENVRLALQELTDLPIEAMELIALMKLQLVGLEAAANMMPSELSGGMRKRAAIARAMALDPQALFLDEPWRGLDPITTAGLEDLILRLAHNLEITFVIVSHELSSILTVADRVGLLDAELKNFVAVGDPRQLKESSADARVQRFFNPRSKPDAAA